MRLVHTLFFPYLIGIMVSCREYVWEIAEQLFPPNEWCDGHLNENGIPSVNRQVQIWTVSCLSVCVVLNCGTPE